MSRKGQRERLRLRASRQPGQRQFHRFLVSFGCSPRTPSPRLLLVCVIMCKVEEKQLEAALSGDRGGRARNQNTSGLLKLLLASPCPESSAGPRLRVCFFFPRLIRWRRLRAKFWAEETGSVCKATQKKVVFHIQKTLCFLYHFGPDVGALPLYYSCSHTCLRAPSVGAASRPLCHCQPFYLCRRFRIRLRENPNQNGWRRPLDLQLIQSRDVVDATRVVARDLIMQLDREA